jgi:YaiO family outer membrane protein
VILAVLAVWAGPLHAQQPSSGYEAAVTARRAGDLPGALALLDRWIAVHPEDSDALVQRGYVHLSLGDRQQAEQDFRAALAIAPAYEDARAGLALIKERENDVPGGFVIAGGSFSDLDSGARDWWEASLAAEAPVSQEVSLGGRAAWYRRFGLEDVEIEGRTAAHPSDNLWLRASIGGTPSADFRPELALSAGADLRIADGPAATVLSLDTAWQRFPLQDVVSITPGITQYFGGGRWWATVRGIGIVPSGANLKVGVLGRLDYAPDDRRRFFAGAVNGPDTDLGIVTRVTSVFAGAEMPLGERWAILPSLAREWRDVGADRTEVRIEIKAAF